MTKRVKLIVLVLALQACGGAASQPQTTTAGSDEGSARSGGGERAGAGQEFVLSDSDDAESAHGEHESQITSTATHAAMRFFVVDPETGPVVGTVVKLTGPDGHSYYTDETDSTGYAEVLVPAGQRYDLEYLSLGRRSQEAHVDVPSGPNQDIRLTLRYRRWRRPTPPAVAAAEPTTPETPAAPEPERLVLEGVLFESGSATLTPDSAPRLDRVVEYMEHHASTRIRIGGHTDNVGNPARNQTLSQQRADSVRTYLMQHGIDGARIEAVGYGDTQPVASNDTEEGRAQNRRIEATEI